jgi:hypothetical protein
MAAGSSEMFVSICNYMVLHADDHIFKGLRVLRIMLRKYLYLQHTQQV